MFEKEAVAGHFGAEVEGEEEEDGDECEDAAVFEVVFVIFEGDFVAFVGGQGELGEDGHDEQADADEGEDLVEIDVGCEEQSGGDHAEADHDVVDGLEDADFLGEVFFFGGFVE